MAEYYNDVFIITRDRGCLFGFNGEFQKCACSGVGEQCERHALKSKQSSCPTRLNSPQSQPLLPIEPIVKPKMPISFINDMIRRCKRDLSTETTPQSLKSYVVRKFNFACDNSMSNLREKRSCITHCFNPN